MDIKQHIREAQGKIIDNLIACESLIAELYTEYSKTDPELASFWHALALEETGHAHQLKTLIKFLDKGTLFQEIGRFDAASIAPVVALAKNELEATRQTPPSRSHALSVALKLETTLIDSHFYETVHADSPEYQAIARHLGAATQKHVEMVRNKFLAFQKPAP